MNRTRASVSVIVPVFNSVAFLEECINSILTQNYDGQFEVIISDDGSTDDSLKVARSYGNRVIILQKPVDCIEKGAASARNRGLSLAKSEIIAFLDSDDYWLPGHLDRIVRALENTSTDVGYAFCRCKKVCADAKNSINISDWTRKRMTRIDKEYHALARSYCIHTNTIVIKNSALKNIGQFNTSLPNGEDSDMWIRISEQYKGIFLDYFGAAYRIDHSPEQLTKIDHKRKREISLHIYISALERSCRNANSDPLRLYLIVRSLLYCNINLSKNLFIRTGQHVAIITKLFALFPFSTFRYVSRRSI